jgi:hypothetical protein
MDCIGDETSCSSYLLVNAHVVYWSETLPEYPDKALKNCMFSALFDSKNDSKADNHKRFLADDSNVPRTKADDTVAI